MRTVAHTVQCALLPEGSAMYATANASEFVYLQQLAVHARAQGTYLGIVCTDRVVSVAEPNAILRREPEPLCRVT
jgi:hypothetical protein